MLKKTYTGVCRGCGKVVQRTRYRESKDVGVLAEEISVRCSECGTTNSVDGRSSGMVHPTDEPDTV